MTPASYAPRPDASIEDRPREYTESHPPLTVRRRPPKRAAATGLVDAFGRRIDHLRLSVTSACDLRCLYCRPAPAAAMCDGARLSDAQRVEFVRLLVDRFGLTQVRLTGGEPLLHPSLLTLIADLRRAAPSIELALTTNGRRLSTLAHGLRSAGLDRLNVSLDSLDEARYRHITGGKLADVLNGLEAADRAGFPPPRINTVALKNGNDVELEAMAAWALRRGYEIRFLEAMPIGAAAEFNRRHFLPASEIRHLLGQSFQLHELPGRQGETAVWYEVTSAGVSGRLGIIAPVTQSFCGGCRRIRLTADGRLFPCLLDRRSVDISTACSHGTLDSATATTLVLQAVGAKPMRGTSQPVPMISLGG